MIGALARLVVLVVLGALLGLAGAASASAASTVTVDVFGVEYEGDDGVNNVVVTDEAAPAAFHTRVRFAEAGITAMAGCTQDGANAAYCDIEDSDRVSLSLLGDNDVATVNGTRTSYTMHGGAGDDTLTGADAERGAGFFPVSDSIQGDEGEDTLFGRAGDDNLDSGPGDGDVVDGGEGEDGLSFYDQLGTGAVLRGGPGFDELFTFFLGPDPVPGVTVDLAAGTAQFPGLPAVQLESVEDADGGEGPDVLLGDGGVNDLEGGSRRTSSTAAAVPTSWMGSPATTAWRDVTDSSTRWMAASARISATAINSTCSRHARAARSPSCRRSGRPCPTAPVRPAPPRACRSGRAPGGCDAVASPSTRAVTRQAGLPRGS